jgi:hypothetical protein
VDAISSSQSLQTDVSSAGALSGLASLTGACKLLIWWLWIFFFRKRIGRSNGGEKESNFVETASEGMWKQCTE